MKFFIIAILANYCPYSSFAPLDPDFEINDGQLPCSSGLADRNREKEVVLARKRPTDHLNLDAECADHLFGGGLSEVEALRALRQAEELIFGVDKSRLQRRYHSHATNLIRLMTGQSIVHAPERLPDTLRPNGSRSQSNPDWTPHSGTNFQHPITVRTAKLTGGGESEQDPEDDQSEISLVYTSQAAEDQKNCRG